jgi:hypothetical protein
MEDADGKRPGAHHRPRRSRTTNERWDNLRDLDRGGQARNWHISTRNTSGFKGVQFVNSNRLRPGLRSTAVQPLGYFKTKIAATIARAAAAIEHEGVDEALKNSA